MSAPPDDGLFAVPPPPRTLAAPAAQQWTRIHGARACDQCRRELAEAGGHGPHPQAARWRHRTPSGDALLCYPHALDARQGGA